MTSQIRTWKPAWPCSVEEVWAHWRRGSGDPTYRIHGGRHWRGMRTPEGPVTLMVQSLPREAEIRTEAWGPGSAWALDHLPSLLGADDDPSGFIPWHPQVAQGWRDHPHWRLGRGGIVWEALVPAIIEQKVTGQEAFAGFRRLIRRFGEAAPGPGASVDLWVAPSPETVLLIPSWEWLKLPVDPGRSRTLMQAARVAASLERTLAADSDEADRLLQSLPGIGVWTSAEVRFRAHGDADAVSFGDFHIAKEIGHALVGRDIDDAELADILEPYRPHRHRVQALLGMRRWRERHGPRMSARAHLPR